MASDDRASGLEDVVGSMSRSHGVDLDVASASLLDGLGSWYARRKHGFRAAAAGLLIGSMAACTDPGVNPGPDPDPDPDPDPGSRVECIDDTAANYASEIGLTIDVSGYDTNDDAGVEGPGGCFTPNERNWFDALRLAELENKISEETGGDVEDFAAYYEGQSVGPMTVAGFLATYDEFKKALEDEPETARFTPRVGWIQNPVPGVKMPGTWHENGDFEPLTNYEIDQALLRANPPDWKPGEGTESFLSEVAGYPQCGGAEDTAFPSSRDYFFNRSFDTETGQFEVLWYEVVNASLLEATITNIELKTEQEPVEHTWFDITLEFDIPEDDRTLFHGDDTVTLGYSHLVGSEGPATVLESVDDLPPHLRVGQTLEPGASLGYVSPYRLTQVLDFNVLVSSEKYNGFGPSFGDLAVLDLAAADYYPEGLEGRLVITSATDARVYGPCPDGSGGFDPVPDEPYPPAVSTTGEEFVYNTDK